MRNPFSRLFIVILVVAIMGLAAQAQTPPEVNTLILSPHFVVADCQEYFAADFPTTAYCFLDFRDAVFTAWDVEVMFPSSPAFSWLSEWQTHAVGYSSRVFSLAGQTFTLTLYQLRGNVALGVLTQ